MDFTYILHSALPKSEASNSEKISEIIDKKSIFPAYHMNK